MSRRTVTYTRCDRCDTEWEGNTIVLMRFDYEPYVRTACIIHPAASQYDLCKECLALLAEFLDLPDQPTGDGS
jgi:hypothetical protein